MFRASLRREEGANGQFGFRHRIGLRKAVVAQVFCHSLDTSLGS
jgi:hypothetical protein